MGKKKLAIKRIENTKTRDVTSSKRRTGLFKKAATACKLYDSEIAIIVFSKVGKPFTFGHSSVDSVIDRFLSNDNSLTRSIDKEEEIKDDDDDEQRRRKLKKKNEDEVITREEMVNRGGGGGGGGGLCSSTSNLLYLRDGDGYSWPSQEDWNSIPLTSRDD